MNRFAKRRLPGGTAIGRALSVLVFLGILAAFLAGLSNISDIADSQELDGLESTILQSAVHCYALEGFYPDSLDYLAEHYGLQYDSGKYLVIYETMGSNLMPDVTVVPRSR